MAKAKKRKYKKKQKGNLYTIVMFLIAVVLFFIIRLEPEVLSNIKYALKINMVPELAVTEGEISVHFIDVGQGDCSLIRLPPKDGERYINILIDSGESGNGRKVISYLESLGIRTLDAVIVTHPHSDHMGCMDEIIDYFEVKSFYTCDFMDSLTPTTASYEDMLDSIERKGLKINTVGAGEYLNSLTKDVTGCEIKVIAPFLNNTETDLNNTSLIIRLKYGSTSFLFTGDAEMEEYKYIRGTIGQVSVLKVGHHGASNATDEALAAELCPKIAVISCGENNDYGHPHEKTIKILKTFGAEIRRTDLEGDIVIISDGENLKTA